MKKRPEHVVIIGMGPSFMDYHNVVVTQDVKLDLVGDEVWTVNAASFDHRTDRIFWMDDLKKEREVRPDTIDRLDWLKVPVVTTTAHPEIVKKSEAYPIDGAAQMSMDIFGKVYLNNTIAYALAYAILLGVKKVSLYGADYTYPNRNFAESGRACVEAWLIAMKALDIEVKLPRGTSLFDNAGRVGNSGENLGHALYGYDAQPTIRLEDGSTLSMQGDPREEIMGRIQGLMNDGPEKNIKEIGDLNRQMKRLHVENDLAGVKEAEATLTQQLTALKLQEVQDAVSKPEPGDGRSSSGSNGDDPAVEDAPAPTAVSGGGVRDGGDRRKPAKNGADAPVRKRRAKRRVPGASEEAVAAGKSAVPGEPGEVAGSPAVARTDGPDALRSEGRSGTATPGG